MSDKDIFDLALARSAWRSMAVVRLGAGNARLSWPKTPLPMPLNVTGSAHASAFAGVDRERIPLDDAAPTALERADGNWGPAARRLGATGGGAGATVASLAAESDRHLAPSIRQLRTRADYWRAWRLVVIWGVAREALGSVLPMSLETLKALTRDLVCLAVPASQVELVWRAVQARHRQFHLLPLVRGKSVLTVGPDARGDSRPPRGAEASHPEGNGRWLLAWRPDTLAAHLARLLTAVTTLGASSRPSSSRPLARHRTRAQ